MTSSAPAAPAPIRALGRTAALLCISVFGLTLAGCAGSAAIGGAQQIATQVGQSPDTVCAGILSNAAMALRQVQGATSGAQAPAVAP